MACGQPPKLARFTSGNKSVAYEKFGDELGGPLLIMLHGQGGPNVILYRQQAAYFAAQGYTVLFLHYFDATGSSMPTDESYSEWVRTVDDLIRECKSRPEWSSRKIVLLGFSLGASVALAAGSQGVAVTAIADWYGNLPDEFFRRLKGMPPLLILHGQRDDIIPIVNAKQLVRLCGMEHFTCENHFYPDQSHGFMGKTLEDADRRTLNFFSRLLR
jgi:dienelactone hydrolase